MESAYKVRYQSQSQLYSLAFSNQSHTHYLAAGSFQESQFNSVQILQYSTEQITPLSNLDHTYPPTKCLWSPASSPNTLLASISDIIRIWSIDENSKTNEKSNLVINNSNEFSPPLTSADWNKDDPTILGVSSIDTTCTIWDIVAERPTQQLIAHDKEVYDIAFAPGVNIFYTVGGDGSLRQFDRRDMDNSNILYERSDFANLLRLAINRNDPYYIAMIMMDSSSAILIDIREPGRPIDDLNGHTNCVNSLAWNPDDSMILATGGDDQKVILWDLKDGADLQPKLVYNADGEINTLQWCPNMEGWMALDYGNYIEFLKV